jgi:hypothetical protein
VRRHVIALLGALAVLLVIGSGVAQAQSVQGVDQTALTGQSASSSATSTQTHPSNSNVSVRIFSPGDNGSVSQSNNSVAGSAAINAASTAQSVTQGQGGSGTQAAGQIAGTGQKADSSATSTQDHPSNSNIDVRIYSPGNGGDVKQSNNSLAGSIAANGAKTDQSADQSQGDSCGCHGSGGDAVQAVGQKALTLQGAKSDATSEQDHPSNDNIPVRIGSPGDNGSVKQSNNSVALSAAGNLASTTQSVGQAQGGGCGCGGDAVQAVGQKAITGQWADSNATSTQKGASNSNTPVRIDSPNGMAKGYGPAKKEAAVPMGGDGDVSQSNNSIALSAAVNAAKTDQSVEQTQGGGCGCQPKDHGYGDGGARVQAIGQWAETWQGAESHATSTQLWPSNSNAPVRDEHSAGSDGSVDQSNSSLAKSLALNLAHTMQSVRQQQ